MRQVAIPLSSSIEPPGWSRIAGGEVHDGADAAQGVAERRRVGEVAEGDLDAHALGPEPARVAHQAADRRPAGDAAAAAAREPTSPVAPVSRSIGGSVSRSMPPVGSRAPLPRTDRQRGTATAMAYVIAEPCIGTKDNSCVEVCPVDCIHPTPDEPDYDKVEMLYIDPEECIDCDACVEACPVDACFAEDQLPDEWQRFVQINAEYFQGR